MTQFQRSSNRPIKVLQFGGGNFLRAFIDQFLQELNDKTAFDGDVLIVKPTLSGDYSELKAQNGMYHVILEGIVNGKPSSRIQKIDVVSKIIHAYNEYERFVDSAKDSDTRFIFSNTTESGIRYNDSDRFDDKPASEFPAKLTKWLYTRYLHFEGDPKMGCLIFPCELIPENGTKLQETILQYALLWDLSSSFREWIVQHNYFYNTLVDRIVSGFPEDKSSEIFEQLGCEDRLLVVGEVYHSFLIQGSEIVDKELPFRNAELSVKRVEDLDAYRKLKVRVLNGAHTAMVPIGLLSGEKTVVEAINNENIKQYLHMALQNEIAPTLLDDFEESEIFDFIDDVVSRFRNPYLKHQLISIALNSFTKFKTRIKPSVIDQVKAGKNPKHLLFALAALIQLYKGSYADYTYLLKDDEEVLKWLPILWERLDNGSIDYREMVKEVCNRFDLLDQGLENYPHLIDRVAKYLEDISKRGIEYALYQL